MGQVSNPVTHIEMISRHLHFSIVQVAARNGGGNGGWGGGCGGSSCDLGRSVLHLRGGSGLKKERRQSILKNQFPF